MQFLKPDPDTDGAELFWLQNSAIKGWKGVQPQSTNHTARAIGEWHWTTLLVHGVSVCKHFQKDP